MFAQGEHIIRLFDEFVPPQLAVQNDRIGLQVGTLRKEVKKVMLTLDVTPEVVDEAIRQHVDLIIAHHAVIFRPLKSLRTDTPAGKIYEKLLKHSVAVYIAHTNWDVANGGVNDVLAQKIALQDTRVFVPTYEQALKKLVVFVPMSHREAMLEALGEAGAGWIGQYSHCTFQLNGTGTFKPQTGTDPYIGTTGQLERVDEVRIETVIATDSEQQRVLEAMLTVHPYEEVAYDLYPLDIKGQVYGLGRIGQLDKPVSFVEFTSRVKRAFGLETVRTVGDLERTVRRVAILGGMGPKHLADAVEARADVYITGDIDFHTAQDALAEGIALIDPGHHVEHLVLEPMQEKLTTALDGTDTVVSVSKTHTDPFRYV